MRVSVLAFRPAIAVAGRGEGERPRPTKFDAGTAFDFSAEYGKATIFNRVF
jgi:hypothetical protein